MATNSKIEWTHHTFNPWRGCVEVHEGCEHCYAAAMSKRNPQVLGTWGKDGTRVVGAEDYWTAPEIWNARAATLGERHRVFCASLADVFEDWEGEILDTSSRTLFVCQKCGHVDHDRIEEGGFWEHGCDEHENELFQCPGCCDNCQIEKYTLNDVRRRLFSLIDATPHLDWLLLTKRPENIRLMWPAGTLQPPLKRVEYFNATGEDAPLTDQDKPRRHNVWLGTSISLQEHADKQIPELLKCRDLAPVLFLSIEPMLGPIDLGKYFQCPLGNRSSWNFPELFPAIDWVIAGGESGPHARPMHPDWGCSLRDQCQAAEVPFFFKQWGEWWPLETPEFRGDAHLKIKSWEWPPRYTDQCLISDRGEMSRLDETWTINRRDGNKWPMAKVGKKAAGRLLDGVEHNEFPNS